MTRGLGESGLIELLSECRELLFQIRNFVLKRRDFIFQTRDAIAVGAASVVDFSFQATACSVWGLHIAR